jgi:hypothetical protein
MWKRACCRWFRIDSLRRNWHMWQAITFSLIPRFKINLPVWQVAVKFGGRF